MLALSGDARSVTPRVCAVAVIFPRTFSHISCATPLHLHRMISTASSGASSPGGGGGGGGSEEQPRAPKRSRLNDVISTVAREVAPFVGGSHQLNGALYRSAHRPYQEHPDEDVGFLSLLAVLKRHRFERPGALAFSVRTMEWLPGGCFYLTENETTSTLMSEHSPWPVTKYAQLVQILRTLPPPEPSKHMIHHFLVFWIGGHEKSFPATLEVEPMWGKYIPEIS